jgi:hypothetical protein
LGQGPVYVVFPEGNGTLVVSTTYAGDWPGQKVLWIVDPSYTGPVMIRGGRLDAPGLIGWGEDSHPIPELSLALPKNAVPSTALRGWRNWPEAARLPAEGCYAYQVDGSGFSYAIVFAARLKR